MKRLLPSALVIAALMSATAHAQPEKSAAAKEANAVVNDIPLDRVVLSTSGLANFVHRAAVSGDAKVEFPVRYEQVDDILKSLVIFDRQGRLGGVTLPGKQPLDQIFRDLPFNRHQLANPMLLLNAYQGAALTLKGVDVDFSGKILQVVPEQTELEDGKTIIKNRISVMTDAGMRQAVLEDLTSIHFEDRKIRDEISRALAAIRENGAAERRVLTVSLPGEGKRNVTLSYVVDAPLWKTAYRMVVPESGAGKGLLQGWAVVENQTAGDWQDVDLTLVSGNPVTFRQSLYESYYVQRPELPVQVFGRILPRVDSGTVASAEIYEGDMAGGGASRQEARLMKSRSNAAPAPAAMAMGRGMAMESMAADSYALSGGGYGGMANVAQAASAAAGAEATSQVLFRFPDRFSLKSGQTMMVPFVSRDVPMTRVALYQPDTHATHPLAAVELTNDGTTGIPGGVLTLYEESALLKGTSFVGDAQLPALSQGEKRLVSYALDTKTTISRTDKSLSTNGKISISRGVLRIAVKNRAETSYAIKAPAREERLVIIEHPKRHDYTLVTPEPAKVEVTETHYRLRVPVKAGETKTVTVALESTGWQSYAITGMQLEQLTAYAGGTGNLDAATRKAFAKMADVRRDMDRLDQQIRAVEQKRESIFRDQERVRENLKSLTGKSDVQQKYLTRLNAQEDEIDALVKERDSLNDQRRKKEEELKSIIDALEI